MLLRNSLRLEAEAKAVEQAVAHALESGARTANLRPVRPALHESRRPIKLLV